MGTFKLFQLVRMVRKTNGTDRLIKYSFILTNKFSNFLFVCERIRVLTAVAVYIVTYIFINLSHG